MSVLSERVTCVEYRIDGTVADVVWWLSSSRAIELYGVPNRLNGEEMDTTSKLKFERDQAIAQAGSESDG